MMERTTGHSRRVARGLVLVAAMLAGCTHTDDAHRQPRIAYLQTLAPGFDDPEATVATLPAQEAVEAPDWWRAAGDPALDALLAKAMTDNNDIMVGAARLAQARAFRGAAVAARLPRLDAVFGASRDAGVRGPSIGNRESYAAEINLGWDPDLFGRLRKDAAAAREDVAAAGFDLDNLQRILRLEVIRTYVACRTVEARIGFAALSVQRQQDILDLVERRFRLGIAVETDLQQARLQLLQVKALEPQLRNERNQLRNRLAVLTGVASTALEPLLDQPAAIPAFPAPSSLGVPADVVRQRPDVRAAERRLIAAGERIGAARAALLPQFSIGASLSTVSPNPAGLFDTIISQTIGRITQSLFAGGAQKAAVSRNRAIADEALAAYRNTILLALESVENALSAGRTTQIRLAISAEALEAAERAAQQARRQNELGLIDFYIVLAAEQSLLAQRDEMAAANAASAIAMAELRAALGERQ